MVRKLEITKEFREGIDWIQSHRRDLHKEYQGKWVAVYRDKVIASGKGFNLVEKKAVEITGVPQTKIPLVFMEDPHCIYISII